jgi:hypothetical protein
MKILITTILILLISCSSNDSNPGNIKETGNLALTIQMQDLSPIEINLHGAFDEVFHGYEMSMHVSSTNAENVEYIWFLDGEKLYVGDSYILSLDVEKGFHQLTILGFTEDNFRGGSVSHIFLVK